MLRLVLGALAVGAFLAVIHNYGVNLLPLARLPMDPHRLTVYSPKSAFAYAYPYRKSVPDDPLNQRSRVRLLENGTPLEPRLRALDEVTLVGGGRWSHLGGQIIFSTIDNSDPRTNGRSYVLLAPRFYSQTIGRAAVAVLLLSWGALLFLARRDPKAERGELPVARWRWHLIGATALFGIGLYCNTGTMPPYANTIFPYADKATGYLYNSDHVHFRVLFDFVDGAPRKVWDHALFIRRILFPVLAWPLMKLAGFEVGGTLASLAINLAVFAACGRYFRRRLGERGSVFALWLMALYPGADYWGGLPYPHALIFPSSLLLMIGLTELGEARGRRFVAISLGMGLLYLGYDLAVFYLPAAFLLLLLRRRWLAAGGTALLQALPLAIWLLVLSVGLKQPLENSNSGVYSTVLFSYKQLKDVGLWWSQVSNFADIGLDVFFGSNFIFIPLLFLAALLLNPLTSRIRFTAAEATLLVAALGLFLFNNLAPFYGGTWNMRGTWIARIYQPVIPALIFFLARWWQELPPLAGWRRLWVWSATVFALAGNALIVFGPIALNPLRLSEYAFYKFYNHTDVHWIYVKNLKDSGRRPLGFPRPEP
jgi:hypothetical protein